VPALTHAAAAHLHNPQDSHDPPGGRDTRQDRVEAAAATLRRVLREHDLRCTSQRMAIVTLLASVDEPTHLTAPEIHTRLTGQGTISTRPPCTEVSPPSSRSASYTPRHTPTNPAPTD